jgi:GTP-binding protein
VVADIPGLIKGAHQGAGLGFHFLRHVERTRVLVHLVDISDLSEGDPVEHYETINRELREYSAALMDKPMAVAATKIDARGDGEKLRLLEEHCRAEGREFFAISAAAHLGLEPLLQYLSDKVME